MSKLSKTFIYLSVALIMSNCGESFRSSETVENNTVTQDTRTQAGFGPVQPRANSEFFDTFGNRISQNQDPSSGNDERIIEFYGGKSGWDVFGTQDLARRIKAFELRISGASNGRFRLQAQVVESCSSSFPVSREVQSSSLQSGQRILIGTTSKYEVYAQCSNSGCSEMVAGIVSRAQSQRGTVLVGLSVAGKVDNSVLYISRTVSGLSSYYATFPFVQRFEQDNRCSVSNGSGQNIWQNLISETADSFVREGFNFLGDLFFGSGSF